MTAVLDASAVLALLFAEQGADEVAETIATGAAISTVNLGEVATVLVRHRRDAEAILAAVIAQVAVEPFIADDAFTSSRLVPATTRRGLSLGDRACLALATRLRGPALTADRAWSDLDVGIEVRLVR